MAANCEREFMPEDDSGLKPDEEGGQRQHTELPLLEAISINFVPHGFPKS